MKLKINFKQTRATSAGDINLPNLLVITIIHTKQLSPIMVIYYFVYLLETIRCDTATVYLLYRISSAQIYTHLQNISGLVWSGYSLIWNSPDLLIVFHRLLFKAKFIEKKKKRKRFG